MIIGQRFWVSDYFTKQEDYLVEFEVKAITNNAHLGRVYISKSVENPSSKEYCFTDTSSIDVFSAKVLKSIEDVIKWSRDRKDYEDRRAKAMEIFPEGFE